MKQKNNYQGKAKKFLLKIDKVFYNSRVESSIKNSIINNVSIKIYSKSIIF